MVFSSLDFCCILLQATFALYFSVPRRARNLVLLVASLVFYAWGEPVYVLLMVFSTLLDYCVGLGIQRYDHDGRMRKRLLLLSMVANIGALGFFKYADFVLANVNAVLGTNIPLLGLPLPIGISFYTFQTMSYTIDVYRREVPAQASFIDFATFVTMFPQLIAGPIVRYIEVQKELAEREVSIDKFAKGVEFFVLGLAHKVLLANAVGSLWSRLKLLPPEQLGVGTAWLGILCYTLQIYFDFGGYSLMAIGCGKMLGFEFPKNFDYPYISRSVAEFWRRWHMTLGSWFREYVYIPLGGNRGGTAKTIRNLAIVWLLTGIWHGASWNFILWGCYYGLILILERFVYGKALAKLPALVQHGYTMLLVMVGWVLFEATDLSWGAQYLRAMFGANGTALVDGRFLYELSSFGAVILLAIAMATPYPEKLLLWLQKRYVRLVSALRLVLIFGAFWLSIAYIIDSSYNPFLYFRF